MRKATFILVLYVGGLSMCLWLWNANRFKVENKIAALVMGGIDSRTPFKNFDVRIDRMDAKVIGLSPGKKESKQILVEVEAELQRVYPEGDWEGNVHDLLITREDLGNRKGNEPIGRIHFVENEIARPLLYEEPAIRDISKRSSVSTNHLLLVGLPLQVRGQDAGRLRAEVIREKLAEYGLPSSRVGCIAIDSPTAHQVRVFVVDEFKEGIPGTHFERFARHVAPLILLGSLIFSSLGLLIGSFIWLPARRKYIRSRAKTRELEMEYRQWMEATGQQSESSSRRRRTSSSKSRKRRGQS